MKFVEESNLFTSIKLALNIGTLWTKASQLSDKSEYEVYTTDAVAAVRGTIFGVNKNISNTNITVKQGKVEVKKVTLSVGNLDEGIRSGNINSNPITSFASLGVGYILSNGKSYIEVNFGSGSLGADINSIGSIVSGTGAINQIPTDVKNNIIENTPELNENIQIYLNSYSRSGSDILIGLSLDKPLLTANFIKITTETGAVYTLQNNWMSNTGSLFLTGGTLFNGSIELLDDIQNGHKLYISACSDNNHCSQKKEIEIKEDEYESKNNTPTHCDDEIKDIYDDFLDRDPTIDECKNILEKYNIWRKNNPSGISDGIKKDIIVNMLAGDDCIKYQIRKKSNISGTGTTNCKPYKVKFNGYDIENDFAGSGYSLVAYAPYNGYTHHGYNYTDYNFYTGALLTQKLTSQTGGTTSTLNIKKDGNIRGVYIHTGAAAAYNGSLAYSGSQLGLNSASGFIIEMSVKGEDLKRIPSGLTNYYLFSTSSSFYKLFLNNDGLKLQNSSSSYIPNSDFNIKDNNKFYKIIAKKENTNYTLNILDDNNKILSSTGFISTSDIGDNLYIGNYFDLSKQWNGIIDYVKVYKK
ncbi:MAG: FecR domain-containing protein [Candidatus Gracilibacteria bacterium]|nr:FecR domain-containing protein [Candidatus Gracilibacteria bacterium]